MESIKSFSDGRCHGIKPFGKVHGEAMSWVTVIWSIGAGACLTLAFLQFIVWWKDRTAQANLAFSVMAIAVAIFAAFELALMRAQTLEQFGEIVRWLHVPLWVMIVSLVAFVRLYLRAGRRWLAWTVVGVRTLSLILNFIFWPNINYRQMTALPHISFLGEPVSVASGVPNPWMLVAQLSLLLLVIFVMDAMIVAWRRGDRRQALVVGGGILFFVLLGTAQGVAIGWGFISMPITVSLFYQALVAAMAYELSYDVIHAAALARRLRTSETGLRKFEERVALAAEAAQLGAWELDTTSNRMWVSDKIRQLYQFSEDGEIVYGEFEQRVHPDDRATRDRIMRRAIQTHGSYETEYRIVLPDGTIRWIGGRARVVSDGKGKPMRLLGVSMDITERKQAEELFHLATEASPSGTVLVDDQGHIVLVNAHIEELFGYRRDELVGKGVEILLPERFARAHANDRASFFAGPEVRAMGAGRELFARRKDGSEFPVEIGLNPIQTPHGLLVLANVVDISARLAAEEEARRRREQVELLSRVSLLGEMTASLAHELNQPLGAIVNNASAAMQYLEQGRLNAERLKEILTDVAADGRRAHDIMRDVRSAIKKGSALRGRINLNDVVKTVTPIVHLDAAARLCKLEMSLARDLPAIEGDPTQIQQVLINLVHNAFDAMGDTPPSRRIIEIVTSHNGDGTVYTGVRDYGSGISETTRERLFEQFFTTKEEGLGMGLAIVRSIIEAHGGSIAAENADGGGARFYFHLPRVKETPQ
jgi:two-component system, LuxR family, sensor kinase FixL